MAVQYGYFQIGKNKQITFCYVLDLSIFVVFFLYSFTPALTLSIVKHIYVSIHQLNIVAKQNWIVLTIF